MKEKVSLASDILEKRLFSSDWIGDKIFEMSEDQINNERDLIVEDVKRTFRYNQIENEGNDPAISGESYGTPHDLASIYKTNAKGNDDLDLPDDYDETKKVKMGRPKEKASIYKTDDSKFGRDPLGSKGMKPSKEEDSLTYKNRPSPFALESVKGLDKMRKKKVVLFEQKSEESGLLDEKNIINDTDL